MFASETVVLAIKLRDLRRSRGNPFLRGLCAAIALASISAFAGIPAVLSFMETASGVPAIWLLGPLVATCAAIQATVLLWSSPAHGARRRILPMIAVYGAAIAVMAILVYRGRTHLTTSEILDNQQSPEALWAATPYLRDAVLVYFTAMIVTFGDVARRLVRNARLVDRRWLRRGLLTLTGGCIAYLLYCLAMTGYFAAIRFGVTLQPLHNGAIDAVAVGTLIFMAGVAMPSLGPRWDRQLAYRRLQPLWLALRRAAPGVVLEAPWSARIDGWNVRNLDFRLYRRVIEIRDCALALRPYFDPGVAETVRQVAAQAHLPARQVEPTVQAAQLALAIQTRQAQGEPGASEWLPPFADSGDDLDAELATLVPLAQAFATSPIVKAITAGDARTNTLTFRT